MKTQFLQTCVALMVVSLSTAIPAARSGDVRTAITAQSDALMRAIERGDATAVASIFAEDAKISVTGMKGVTEGRAAIESFWRGLINEGLRKLPMVSIDLAGSGDLRVETGTYSALGAGSADYGGGHYLIVWQRESGTWRILREFAVANPAPPPPAAAAAFTDRVGFPANYRAEFKLLAARPSDDGSEVLSTYANAAAAAVTHTGQLPYPNESVLVMEFARTIRDGEGQLLRDPSGEFMKGEITHVDVMRRGDGFGAIYGTSRAGEWEFASYSHEGRTLIAPGAAAHCAACHANNAGATRDFVFRPQIRLVKP